MHALTDLKARLAQHKNGLLIGIGLLLNSLLILFLLLPAWANYSALATDLDAARVAATQHAPSGEDDTVAVLQAQIASMEDTLNAAAAPYLTAHEADRILDQLYQYAMETEVTITALQTLAADASAAEAVVVERRYTVELEGSVLNVLQFVTALREAAALSVNLEQFTLHAYDPAAPDSLASLTFQLVLYTSTYATGEVFAALPTQHTPTPVPAFPTPLPTLTATPTATLTPSPTSSPTMTPTPAATITPYITATPTLAGPVLGAGVYDDGDPVLTYTAGTWEAMTSQGGYGGTYHYSADLDAQVTLSFMGTGVTVQYVAFRNFGIFEVLIDGVLVSEVDSYAPDGLFGRVVQIAGLGEGIHTLTIRNTDRRNAASSGNIIALDAVHIVDIGR